MHLYLSCCSSSGYDSRIFCAFCCPWQLYELSLQSPFHCEISPIELCQRIGSASVTSMLDSSARA